MDLIKDWLKRQLSNPQIVLLASVLLVVFLTIFFLGGFLAPVLASAVIAYLLDGIIMRFQKHGVPRLVAVCGVFVLFLLSIFLLFFVVFPSLVTELDKFVRNDVPGIVTNVSNNMKGAYQKYEYFRNKRLPDFFTKQLQPSKLATPSLTNSVTSIDQRSLDANEIEGPLSLTDEAPFDGVSLSSGEQGADPSSYERITSAVETELTEIGRRALTFSISSLKNIVVYMLYLVLVPVLVFFILKDKQAILNWFAKFLPSERSLTRQVWEEVNIQTSNYVRGKFWEVIIVWGVTYVTLKVFEIKAALLVSLFVGLSVLVPYVGATLMYIPIVILGYYQFGMSSTFVYLFIAYSIIQVLDGNVLAPVLLSEATSLHPIAIIAAILLFGGLWGFWGVFFAIPLATLVNSIIKAWPMEINKTLQR
ncbi:MAG: AI-2E family transporter [Limisphaerales bacterium]|nr:AI-2E family transporter [Pedosphaera sp.]HAW02801.1 AI-2E family transporter [Verrucomicrobiales bacterium]HBP57638.1 AI-2E family transporter [Verrucomicrobiales bacterium]HCP37096.1 AI-2E family transporter [Verrucomicrobiales bacterium]HCZ04109.1 AI-2E family transporter [Verrucomicrobiales bacterium]|tara:strand:+ start:2040 stop:3296 length:1257 start_codon:yes stop_codon:yes gene_type:complete